MDFANGTIVLRCPRTSLIAFKVVLGAAFGRSSPARVSLIQSLYPKQVGTPSVRLCVGPILSLFFFFLYWRALYGLILPG